MIDQSPKVPIRPSAPFELFIACLYCIYMNGSSGHIASALASQRSKDVCVVVAALQLVHMLLEKMADVYGPLFRKEGVSHEVRYLVTLRWREDYGSYID